MTTIPETTRPDGAAVGRDIISWLAQGDNHGLELSWLCIRHAGFEPRALALLNALADSDLAYPDPVHGLRFYGHPAAIQRGLERLGLPNDLLDIRYVRPGR